MSLITVYTQSLNHLGERIFISQIEKDGNITEDIKTLNNPEISEEDLAEINKLIKLTKPGSNLVIYTLSAYQNKNNNLKEKWINTASGKDFISLMSDYNISLKTYTKAQENFKNELIKKMTSFHKMNTNKKQKNTHQTILSTDKIYNFNDKICDVVNIYLRGNCDISSSNKNGYYIALISKNDKKHIVKGNDFNTTSNRMLLTGLIKAIKVLNKPCLIKLYTHTHLGFLGGDTNSDLKEELFRIITVNNHAIVETITNEKQDYLKTLYNQYSKYKE